MAHNGGVDYTPLPIRVTYPYLKPGVVALFIVMTLVSVGLYKGVISAPHLSEPSLQQVRADGKQSILDLVRHQSGKQQVCDWTEKNSFMTSSGKVYLDGKRFAIVGGFQTTVGWNIDMHAVGDQKNAKIWLDTPSLPTLGTVAREITFDTESASDDPTIAQARAQLTQEMDFQCGHWTPSEATFALPPGLVFTK